MSFEREPLPSIERVAQDVVREVRQYIREMDARIASGRGVWFAGDIGTGKTTLAMLISKAALERDYTVAIYSMPRLMSLLRATYDESSRHSLLDLMDRLCAVDLLHIDDVGAEQTTPWVLEQVYSIVNTRYEDGRPLVLTTNLIEASDPPVKDPATGEVKRGTDGELVREPRDAPLRRQIGDRTVSRIYEICGNPLDLYGHDSRPRPDVTFPDIPQGENDVPPRSRNHPAIAGNSVTSAADEDAFWEGAAPPRYGRGPLDG